MPVVSTSAYDSVETILSLARSLVNDAEIPGGDVLTDNANFSMPYVNAGYRRVQIEIASRGGETLVDYAWLIGLPAMPSTDPEARLIVADNGTTITYPSGVGNSSLATPVLPDNLITPLDLWERQTATSNPPVPMKQRNNGLITIDQQNFLVDWEWVADTLQFRGALQSQDVKIKFEKKLPAVAASTDPVPIRGVVNAVAEYVAFLYARGRGGQEAIAFSTVAMEEIMLLVSMAVRRRQRIKSRRRPFRGLTGRNYGPI